MFLFNWGYVNRKKKNKIYFKSLIFALKAKLQIEIKIFTKCLLNRVLKEKKEDG